MTIAYPALGRLAQALKHPLLCIDLETSGGHPERDRIIEIGLISINEQGEAQEWQQLIDAGCSISSHIQALTGIHPAMLTDMPSFSQLCDQLSSFLRDSVVIAHNARFDAAFLRQALQREGAAWTNKLLCSLKISRALEPAEEKHGIDALIHRHGLDCTTRHRALGDARVVAQYLDKMATQRFADLLYACQAQWQRTGLPPWIDAGIIDDIPNRCGVYRFYGENDLPLYIGKSIHLQKRVLQHFRSDFKEMREMQLAQQVRRIEWTETAGELGALLLESRLVKELQPILNRQLRRQQRICSIYWNPDGKTGPSILCGKEIEPGRCYGVFRSRHSARAALRDIAEEVGACGIRLGLEGGPGPCFNYQLHRCRGLCAGTESVQEHDERLRGALERLLIRQWPYAGPIAIPEGENGATLHVFDQWHYLGMADAKVWDTQVWTSSTEPFDIDTYRILLRYLRKPGAKFYTPSAAGAAR
ncbi:MAG: exonuclease domain-containing protein [Candidatus Igneacidithiobacillus chanchocoensis]